MRKLALGALLVFSAVVVACSSDDSSSSPDGGSQTCDDLNGACAPQCIPYAVCTSEGSTCVIGGAACGHYWLCHGGTWVSDVAEDCDSGFGGGDAAAVDSVAPMDASADNASPDGSAEAASDAAEAGLDDAQSDAPVNDGDDGG